MTDAQIINIIISTVAMGVIILGAIATMAYFMFKQMNVIETRLTNRIGEVNNDTKSLIHEVGVLKGQMSVLIPVRESEASTVQ